MSPRAWREHRKAWNIYRLEVAYPWFLIFGRRYTEQTERTSAEGLDNYTIKKFTSASTFVDEIDNRHVTNSGHHKMLKYFTVK